MKKRKANRFLAPAIIAGSLLLGAAAHAASCNIHAYAYYNHGSGSFVYYDTGYNAISLTVMFNYKNNQGLNSNSSNSAYTVENGDTIRCSAYAGSDFVSPNGTYAWGYVNNGLVAAEYQEYLP